MNLREVRESAKYVQGIITGWEHHSSLAPELCEIADAWRNKLLMQSTHILATIDPEPEAAITAEWLRDEWGWDSHGTMSMHYDHDEYTAFSWREDDGVAIVAKAHQLRCYTTGFPINTRQQFTDLARCLGIPRRKDGAK